MKKSNLRTIWIALVIVVAVLAALLIVVISQSLRVQQEEDDSRINFLIGVSQANLSEPWQVFVNQDIKKAASKYTDMRLILMDGASNSSKQIDDINKLLDLGIDLLIVSPTNEVDLEAVISKAYESIPVIVLDKDIPNEHYTLFIGVDNYKIGQEAGRVVCDLLGDEGGKVLEIKGSENSDLTVKRSEGLRSVIDEHDNVEIVQTLTADWLRDLAEDDTKEALAQYPDIDLVFAHNDDMAYGAYIAAQKMRIGNIKFVGIGGLEGVGGGLDLVKKGILNATFTNTIAGGEAVDYAMAILDGNTADIPKKLIMSVKCVLQE